MKEIVGFKLPPKIRMGCYKYALYSVFQKYNCNPKSLLFTNDVIIDYSNSFKVNDRTLIEYENIFIMNGLKIINKIPEFQEDVENIIKSAVNLNQSVICFIDTFYYSCFPATYNKIHALHAIPIFGYDDEKKVYKAIDSDFMNDFQRKFREIPYETLSKSVMEFKNTKYYNNKSTGQITREPIQIIYKNSTTRIDTLYEQLNIFKEFFCSVNCKKTYEKHLFSLSCYCDHFSSSYKDEKIMIRESSADCFQFDKFINFRMLEYYIMTEVLSAGEELIDTLSEIIEIGNLIRSIMYRTSFTKVYREKSFYRCAEELKILVEKETNRYKLLFEFWEKNSWRNII